MRRNSESDYDNNFAYINESYQKDTCCEALCRKIKKVFHFFAYTFSCCIFMFGYVVGFSDKDNILILLCSGHLATLLTIVIVIVLQKKIFRCYYPAIGRFLVILMLLSLILMPIVGFIVINENNKCVDFDCYMKFGYGTYYIIYPMMTLVGFIVSCYTDGDESVMLVDYYFIFTHFKKGNRESINNTDYNGFLNV